MYIDMSLLPFSMVQANLENIEPTLRAARLRKTKANCYCASACQQNERVRPLAPWPPPVGFRCFALYDHSSTQLCTTTQAR